jgi:uncharacterized membrane protein YedE/YeeE
MKALSSVVLQLVAGLIFGLGLVIAGMSDPAKVLSFLDVAAITSRSWDGSLALVMAGAIGVGFVGFRLVLRRPTPVFAARFHVPENRPVDARLLTGAALFGVGWGLAGLCPGPAFTALTAGTTAPWLFMASMLVGMGTARWLA